MLPHLSQTTGRPPGVLLAKAALLGSRLPSSPCVEPWVTVWIQGVFW